MITSNIKEQLALIILDTFPHLEELKDLLTNDEIKKACLACISGGADFVKTSTGFVKNGLGARPDFVRLMAQTVEKRGLGVKASGGISTRFQAKELIEAGATRLGTSSGVAIVNPQK